MFRHALALSVLSLASLVAPAHAQICTPFTDVAASNPFCGNIQWMLNRGVTSGCGSNVYCPTQFVTREQMAAFMNRLANKATFQQGGNAFGAAGEFGTTDDQALELIANNSRVMRYEPNAISPNVIGGSPANSVSAGVRGATIAGGGVPTGDTDPDFVFEAPNRVTDAYGTVGGGYANVAGDDAVTTTNAAWATVGGGILNTASGRYSTVPGGALNTASGYESAVVGGSANTASGSNSTVAGGFLNTASGAYSFAAGRNAKATAPGSFMWADSNSADFGVPVLNFFGVRATGGVGFTVAIDRAGLGTQFCNLLPGVVGWQCVSDREMKENFEAVEGEAILAKLASMPLFTWNFKGADPDLRNLGPTAQDFHAAFGLGTNEKVIASGNLHGVALAAIQGISAKVDRLDAAHNLALAERDLRIEAQQRQIAELNATIGMLLARDAVEAGLAVRASREIEKR